ncbi:MAG TPA: PIG-L family deacetylase [Longimicrobiaceae bacterium]|nr:PIG-L family deacetylase [Longimicrobiaceae bacterium]
MTKLIISFIMLPAALLAASVNSASAQAPALEYEGAAALGLTLRQLGTTERVLMIGAHPDDESTQILSELALGHGAEVAYLALTRGEGGQNGIGPELQEGLGLLRTEELLAARRLDGARQYFSRAYDYGYSKSADEAFRHWPHDEVLADVVAVIREFRPDVILSVFTGTPSDGHGQHQAAGILAREAFTAAGDPSRFPDQIESGLGPHQPAKFFFARWRGGDENALTLETGDMDPLLGRSAYQVAMASRSRHRSQDMGQILVPGPHSSSLQLVESRVVSDGGAAARSIFSGIDTTLVAWGDAGTASVGSLLRDYQNAVADARSNYNPLQPGQLVPQLAQAVATLAEAEGALSSTAAGDDALLFRISAEKEQASEALRRASGIVLDAISADETVTPGQTFELELVLWNGGDRPIQIKSLRPELPPGWSAEPVDPVPAQLAAGELLEQPFRVSVPAAAEPTEPYFLESPRQGDMYTWPAERGGVGIPFEPAAVRAVAEVEIAGANITVDDDATYRTVDKMSGEIRRPVRVVPAVSVSTVPSVAVVTTAPGEDSPGPLQVTVRTVAGAADGVAGTLRLDLPAGWTAAPASVPLELTAEGEVVTTLFEVTPPQPLTAGEYRISAVFESQAVDSFARGYQLVDYPHTRPRALYSPATTTVEAFDVQVPDDLAVAYIPGAGDEIPAALAQLGLDPTILDPPALAAADLDAFDVIVTGIRAYEVRPDLVAANPRILEYVEDGGTLIVQYNKYEFDELNVAPYPATMNRPHDRVTDETAPVTIIEPEHQVVTWPNRITAADFDGWIQERGLYFLHEWDSRYTPILAMSDPGEEPLLGSLLIAPYGDGTYVYTGISFFRELPAGVPGAYRLFANLLALGAK